MVAAKAQVDAGDRPSATNEEFAELSELLVWVTGVGCPRLSTPELQTPCHFPCHS